MAQVKGKGRILNRRQRMIHQHIGRACCRLPEPGAATWQQYALVTIPYLRRSQTEPEEFSTPSTTRPSLMLIDDESLELNVVPFTMNSPRFIFPVPDVVSVRSPLLGADIVEPFTRISPSVFNVSAYERLAQAADPSPILNLFESDSQPNSPAASVGLLLVQSAAVSLRS